MSIKNKWLIKTNSKILGPYSFEQVEDLLLKKQISIIDEIKDMSTRWLHIREKNDFKSTVERIRQQQDDKQELTQTTQTQSQLTQTFLQDTLADIQIKQESEALNLQDIIEVPQILKSTQKTIPKVVKVKTEIPKNNSIKILLSVAVFILISFGGYFIYNYTVNSSRIEKSFLQKIRKNQLYFQTDHITDVFKKMSSEQQDKILPEVIPLWLILEKSGAFNYQRAMSILSSGKITSNEKKAQYQLVKFNKAFNLSDVQNAQDALVKAYDFDSTSLETKENDGILKFFEKKYADSSKLFKQVYDQSQNGRSLYLYTLSELNNPQIKIIEILETIDKHIQQRWDFKKELALISLFLIRKNKIEYDQDKQDKLYADFFNTPIRFQSFFKLPYLVNGSLIDWTQLSGIIDDLSKLDPVNADLFKMHLLAETNQIGELKKELVEKKIPDEHFKNFQSYINFTDKDKSNLIEVVESDFISTRFYYVLFNNFFKNNYPKEEILESMINDKGLFSIWSRIQMISNPQEELTVLNLIKSEPLYANDFIPYLDLKFQFSEKSND